jgi:hypothetical protein
MTTSHHPINVAVLDDYQGVALSIDDWSKVSDRANINVFHDHLADQDALAERLAPFRTFLMSQTRSKLPQLHAEPPLSSSYATTRSFCLNGLCSKAKRHTA